MSKLNSNYELISNKASNPVTTTPYIKHGEKWLDEMLNESGGRIDAVEDGVAANTEAISQNTTNISINTTNISGLDTRVTALEQGGGGGGGGDNVGRIDRTEGATQHGEIFNLYTGTQINQATGYMSHAEGNETKAEGSSSHSEGYKTTASGSQSHAEGAGSVASGDYSHAEGNYTTAYDYAHAEGESSTASGTASHAEGHYTHAEGKYSHAEGEDTYATKDGAHAEGLESNASGSQSHAEGNSTTASGSCSHAEGSGTTASGSCSHAEGGDTTASGTFAHAEGTSTTAFGYYSHAEGFNTQATASGSHAEGNGARAFKEAAHAEGVQTTADGLYAHAEGNYTTASAEAAHAEGKNSIASGLYSHAEGEYTYAEDWGAHSEGKNTTASGKYSHAENSYNEATGENSHAEGNYTISSGYRTHTEGFHTKASGDNAHAEGYYTKASSKNQHVSGTANIEDKANKYAVIVGNGLWEGNESNAYTLDWQGNAWYAGDVTGNKDGEEYKLSDMKDKYTFPEGGIPASDLAEGVLPTVTDEYNPEGTAAVSGKAVAAAISAIPTPMQFKGTLGTGGTKTSLPTAEASNEGHTYRVITAGTYASQAAKVGDVFVSNGSAWIYIPAGDDAANSIVMTNYTSDKSSAGTSAIANTDTVTKAIGKVDNRLGNAETEIEKKVNKTSVSSGDTVTANVLTVPANAQAAGIMMIGGKTQKIIQAVSNSATWAGDSKTTVSTDGNNIVGTAVGTQSGNIYVNLVNVVVPANHIWLGIVQFTGSPSTDINAFIQFHKSSEQIKIKANEKLMLRLSGSDVDSNKLYVGVKYSSTVTSFQFDKNVQVFDLTAMYGAGNEPTLEQCKAIFTDYIPYTEGDLWNAAVEKVISRGTNVFDGVLELGGYVWSSGAPVVLSDRVRNKNQYIPVKPNTLYFANTKLSILMYDANKQLLTDSTYNSLERREFTTLANAAFINLVIQAVTDVKYDVKISSVNGVFTSYNKTELSLAELAEKLPDYGKSAGNAYNYIDNERGVYMHCVLGIRVGDSTWEVVSSSYPGTYRTVISKNLPPDDAPNICEKYDSVGYSTMLTTDKTCYVGGGSQKVLSIHDNAYSTAAAFKEANKDLIVYYALAQPEEIPLSSLISPLVVEPGGTIEFVNEHNLDVPNKVIYKKEV